MADIVGSNGQRTEFKAVGLANVPGRLSYTIATVRAKVEDVILLYDNKAIFTPVGGGSDGTSASAWVMKEAAVACKKILLDLAAPKFKAKPEDLETRDTMVYLKSDPGQSMPFGERLLWRDRHQPLHGRSSAFAFAPWPMPLGSGSSRRSRRTKF